VDQVKGDQAVQKQLLDRQAGEAEARPCRGRRDRMRRGPSTILRPLFLPTPDSTRPLLIGWSFPKPLSSVPLFGYNPHSFQPSGPVQLALSGEPALGVAGLFCGRPGG